MAGGAGLGAQIADLSGRLQLTNKATNMIVQELRNHAQQAEKRHAELLEKAGAQDRLFATQLVQFDARLTRVEQLLQVVQRDLESKDGRFNQLQETLRSSHLSLSENLQGHLLSGKSFFCVGPIVHSSILLIPCSHLI